MDIIIRMEEERWSEICSKVELKSVENRNNPSNSRGEILKETLNEAGDGGMIETLRLGVNINRISEVLEEERRKNMDQNILGRLGQDRQVW